MSNKICSIQTLIAVRRQSNHIRRQKKQDSDRLSVNNGKISLHDGKPDRTAKSFFNKLSKALISLHCLAKFSTAVIASFLSPEF